jgi:hypothetical protein
VAASRPAQESGAAQSPRRPAPAQEKPQAQGTDEGERMANEQQLLSIRKLCAALGREEPAAGVLTFLGVATILRQLSKEFNNRRRAG